MKKTILVLYLISTLLFCTGCSIGGNSDSGTVTSTTATTQNLSLNASLGTGTVALNIRAASLSASKFKFRIKAMSAGEPTGVWTEILATANADGTFGALVTVSKSYTEFITELLYTADGSVIVSAIQDVTSASGTAILADVITTAERIAFDKWKVAQAPTVKNYSSFKGKLTALDINAINLLSGQFISNLSSYVSYIAGETTASTTTFLNEWNTNRFTTASSNVFSQLDRIASMVSVDSGLATDTGIIPGETGPGMMPGETGTPGIITSGTVALPTVSTSSSDRIYTSTTSASWAAISGVNSTLSAAGKTAPYTFSASDSDASYDVNGATIISLNNSSTQVSGSGASFANGVVTIDAAGTYVLSGSLDGHIFVDGKIENGVTLVLNGVTISGQTHAAIYSEKKSTPVTMILVSGTTNTLSDVTSYTYHDDDEPVACLYVKGDLLIKGNGALIVNGNSDENGIQSKGEDNGLVITGGTITVNTKSDGIKGKKIAISGGTFNVTTSDGGECLEATEFDIYITGGDFNFNSSKGDGMKAENDWEDDTTITPDGSIYICGGNFNLTTFGDGIQATKDLVICAGRFSITTTDTTFEASDESSKGIKTGTDSQAGQLIINGGDFTFNTTDHSIKSKGSVEIYESPAIRMYSTLGKGISGTGNVIIGKSGEPKIYVTKAEEGIESKSLLSIEGGDIRISVLDVDSDGLNCGGDAPIGINISGGYTYIEVNGDGVDTNKDLTISGGTLVSNSTFTTMAQAAIDSSEGTFTFTGGTIIALGSSQMSHYPDSSTSSVPSLNINFSGLVTAGRLIHIMDSSQNEVVTCFAKQDSDSFVFCSNKIRVGETYSIYTGGSHSGTYNDGVFTGGSYTPGTHYNTVMQENMTTTLGAATPMTNPGGMGGTPPDGGMGGPPPMPSMF